jgi:hypothetical protein
MEFHLECRQVHGLGRTLGMTRFRYKSGRNLLIFAGTLATFLNHCGPRQLLGATLSLRSSRHIMTAGIDIESLQLPNEVRGWVEEMGRIHQASLEHLKGFLQLPEPNTRLDLDGRNEDEVRQFKHLHQMCLIHSTHFGQSGKLRATYLADSYLSAVRDRNPYGIYNAARALLEVYAMTAYVSYLLQEASKGETVEWRSRGERFFETIIQARYGSTDPAKRELLIDSKSIDEKAVQPLRLSKARKHLESRVAWIEQHYVALCDVVHPNLASQRVGSAGTRAGLLARSSGGGAMILTQESTIVHYEYGRPEPARSAVLVTADRALSCLKGIIEEHNGMPDSPFSDAEKERWTGSSLGIPFSVLPSDARKKTQQVGRNEPCPCGSGRKYKRCHGMPGVT